MPEADGQPAAITRTSGTVARPIRGGDGSGRLASTRITTQTLPAPARRRRRSATSSCRITSARSRRHGCLFDRRLRRRQRRGREAVGRSRAVGDDRRSGGARRRRKPALGFHGLTTGLAHAGGEQLRLGRCHQPRHVHVPAFETAGTDADHRRRAVGERGQSGGRPGRDGQSFGLGRRSSAVTSGGRTAPWPARP